MISNNMNINFKVNVTSLSFKQTSRTPAAKGMKPQDPLNKTLFDFLSKTRENTLENSQGQSAFARFDQLDDEIKKGLTFDDRPISELTSDEAAGLIGKNGFFGVAKTSARIADFVLAGAGDDLEQLRNGRKGILKGFEDAEKLWGAKLPDISYETLETALKAIDDRIAELGGSVVDLKA